MNVKTNDLKNMKIAGLLMVGLYMIVGCDFTDPHTLNVHDSEKVGVSRPDPDQKNLKDPAGNSRIYDFSLYDIDGKLVSLKKYRGKTLLVVNTASRCGYTPQYEQLQDLYERYHDKGLEILAFPSNDFGGQELETNEEIATFCYTRYAVDFPLFAKTKVRGEKKHPLYRHLTDDGPLPGEIRWNFEKFLVNRRGDVIKRYYSSVIPLSEEIITDVELELALPG